MQTADQSPREDAGFRFSLDEAALRAALDEESWIIPFAPLEVDADELHDLVRQCEVHRIITTPVDHACLAVFPLAVEYPEPQLAVNPGLGGPLLLGSSVEFDNGLVPDPVEGSVAVIADLVDQANRILAEAFRSYRAPRQRENYEREPITLLAQRLLHGSSGAYIVTQEDSGGGAIVCRVTHHHDDGAAYASITDSEKAIAPFQVGVYLPGQKEAVSIETVGVQEFVDAVHGALARAEERRKGSRA
jgi:hypothetical protein